MKHTLHIVIIFILAHLSSPVGAETEIRIFLFTDRQVYITGEAIAFNCTMHKESQKYQVGDKLLFLELYSSGNEQIAAHKLLAVNGQFNGYIDIPEELKTGYYYLIASVSCPGPGGIVRSVAKPILVFNPYNSEVLNGNTALVDTIGYRSDTIAADGSGLVNIQLNSDSVSTRQSVQITLHVKDSMISRLQQGILTVAPAALMNGPGNVYSGTVERPSNAQSGAPESYGVMLIGKVTSPNGVNRPVEVNMTILDKQTSEFYPRYSDSAGHFSFIMPRYYGRRDLFISANPNDPELELLIDNDFPRAHLKLEPPPLEMSNALENAVLLLAANLKIQRHFYPGMITGLALDTDSSVTASVPFYGEPDVTIDIDEYIEMQTLADYFTELLVPVRIKKVDGKRNLIVTGEISQLNIYPPLVMVDYVPVYSDENVLDLDPQRIKKVDIVSSLYVRGDIIYGGIINVISRTHDFAGIKLPEKGLFIDYQFLSQSDELRLTDAYQEELPDPRSTLYWNANLNLSEMDSRSITFQAGDSRGEYLIRLSLVDAEGELIELEKKFTIF